MLDDVRVHVFLGKCVDNVQTRAAFLTKGLPLVWLGTNYFVVKLLDLVKMSVCTSKGLNIIYILSFIRLLYLQIKIYCVLLQILVS